MASPDLHAEPPDPTGAHPTGVSRRRWSLPTRRWQRISLILAALLLLVWTLLPAIHGFSLIQNVRLGASAPPASAAGIPVRAVRFTASDGASLAGWLAIASPTAPTIILSHGYKGSRLDMRPWARFLYAAGYNVLLYDSRGCGQSSGWAITMGVREPNDILGAVAYLRGRTDPRGGRIAVLGVSLGAGAALLAAARDPHIAAVIADSAWSDTAPTLARMGTQRLGPLALPLLPYEPALVDALIGGRLEVASPRAVIAHIAPRPVLLIHSADDGNALTPLSGERALYAAAGAPKQQWIAPSGGHAGALAAHPADYQRVVLAFLATYLRG